MRQRKRFYIALACYAALAALVWVAMDDTQITIANLPQALQGVHVTLRQLTLAFLAMLVVRTVLYWRAEQIRAEREGRKDEDGSEKG